MIFSFVVAIVVTIAGAKGRKLKSRARLGSPQDKYEYGIWLINKNEDWGFTWEEKKNLFKEIAEQGHSGAIEKLNEIKDAEKTFKRKCKESEEQKQAHLESLPKCPSCGTPIEPKYVNEYWGYRYMHATYTENKCSWSDDVFQQPYSPL